MIEGSQKGGLEFQTEEDAVNWAKKRGYKVVVQEEKKRKPRTRSIENQYRGRGKIPEP